MYPETSSAVDLEPALTITVHTGTHQDIVFLIAISFVSWTHLIVISGIMTAHLYDLYIIKMVMLPFILQCPRLTFQHDNARPRTTHAATNFFQASSKLPWTVWSPNLSLIEHFWSAM